MRKIYSFLIFCFAFFSGFAQSINPLESTEICPYETPVGHTITFPDAATNYTIGAVSNVEITNYYNTITGRPNEATLFIKFLDNSSGEHKFEIKKNGVRVKDFVFTRIKSIAERNIPTLPSSISAPLCSTSGVGIVFSEIYYRKTGSDNMADEFGNAITQYEYDLPSGWTGGNGFSGQDPVTGYWLGSAVVTVSPAALNGGTIRVLAVNQQCSGLKPTPWKSATLVLFYNIERADLRSSKFVEL